MKCTAKQAAAALLFQFQSSGGTHPRDLAPDALLAQLNFCVGSQVTKRTAKSRSDFAGRIQVYLKRIEAPFLQRLVVVRPSILNSRPAFETDDDCEGEFG